MLDTASEIHISPGRPDQMRWRRGALRDD
jgi:hypothetical protein